MARALLGKPGVELGLLTDVDERMCYRYASGDVRPPAYFLRTLLRGEQGERFFRFLMDGSDAAWWRAWQRALRLAAQIDRLDLD